jgi:hypothetical protein
MTGAEHGTLKSIQPKFAVFARKQLKEKITSVLDCGNRKQDDSAH